MREDLIHTLEAMQMAGSLQGKKSKSPKQLIKRPLPPSLHLVLTSAQLISQKTERGESVSTRLTQPQESRDQPLSTMDVRYAGPSISSMLAARIDDQLLTRAIEQLNAADEVVQVSDPHRATWDWLSSIPATRPIGSSDNE